MREIEKCRVTNLLGAGGFLICWVWEVFKNQKVRSAGGFKKRGMLEVSKSAGCGRFQNVRGTGGSKTCGVREVSKSARCGRFQKVRGAGGSKKCGMQELETCYAHLDLILSYNL